MQALQVVSRECLSGAGDSGRRRLEDEEEQTGETQLPAVALAAEELQEQLYGAPDKHHALSVDERGEGEGVLEEGLQISSDALSEDRESNVVRDGSI